MTGAELTGTRDDGPVAETPSALWRRAAAFAERAHEGQHRRDGKTPYSAHVARVAMTIAASFGCTDDACLAIAWLHDVIEDTTTDYDDLLDAFGAEVARGVAALTKNSALPEAEREQRYDECLRAAGWRPRLVKLADVLDNMLDSVDEPIEKDGGRRRRMIGRAERALLIARELDPGEGREPMLAAIGIVGRALEAYRTAGGV